METQGRVIPGMTPTFWNIAFMPRDREHWWDWLSPRWCRHVLAYGYAIDSDCWIIVDPWQSRTILRAVPNDQMDDFLRLWMAEGAAILRVRAKDEAPTMTRGAQVCTTIVGRVTGCGHGAWRPLTLARNLVAEAEIRHDPNQWLSKLRLRKKTPKPLPAKKRRNGVRTISVRRVLRMFLARKPVPSSGSSDNWPAAPEAPALRPTSSRQPVPVAADS